MRGEDFFTGTEWTTRTDHPRMRGEDHVAPRFKETVQGSPPHARGRRRRTRGDFKPWGITPACAGKTQASGDAYGFDADHPRMRGEDPPLRRRPRQVKGSPPHARGRPIQRRSNLRSLRITPACAGKTSESSLPESARRDHPRMRGEDPVDISGRRRGAGSPPHARGRRQKVEAFWRLERITPACAGKTVSGPL